MGLLTDNAPTFGCSSSSQDNSDSRGNFKGGRQLARHTLHRCNKSWCARRKFVFCLSVIKGSCVYVSWRFPSLIATSIFMIWLVFSLTVLSSPDSGLASGARGQLEKVRSPALEVTGDLIQLYEEKVNSSFPKNGLEDPELQNIIRKCSENKAHPGQILYFDTTPYLLNEPEACQGDVYLLAVVHSTQRNIQRRNIIRQTWGSIRQIGPYRMKLLFFLGNSGIEELQKRVNEESEKFRDIIQRDFQESYRNITRKHLTAMEWTSQHCPLAHYVMKVDDDTFVDTFHVIRIINANPIRRSFYCTATVGAKPQRKRRRNQPPPKWLVTRAEFGGKIYPTYCEGLGYIMDGAVARELHWCSRYSKFFWIDDVYVTGVLAQKLGISRQRFLSGHGSAYLMPSHASYRILDFIFLMAFNNEFMPETWMKLWRAAMMHSIDI